MYRFNNDYNKTCHPYVLEYLSGCKNQYSGYGEDDICSSAAKLLRERSDCPDADVHFLNGGTQTNLTVICAALRPHQGVICAQTGHIHVHETGAIEASGHKIITVPSVDGKIEASQVEALVIAQRESQDAVHFVQPKLVYISNPTEYGTLYNYKQLEELSVLCRKLDLLLYVDGARMGYALTAEDNDVSLADIARLTDAFYIGGTKCGAMFGEAVVITNPGLSEDFRYIMKQRGAMLAKGWLLGAQFCALFESDLYFKICSQANEYADLIRARLSELNLPLFITTSTNQIFPIISNDILEELQKKFSFAYWEKYDEDHSVVRFCTSWSTTAIEVDALCEELKNLMMKH